MRPRSGRHGASLPRRSRWARQPSVRGERDAQRSALIGLMAVAVFLLTAVAGFAWAMDRQLRGGLLAQHAEAVQRPDWVSIHDLPGYVPLAFLVAIDPTFLHRSPVAMGVEGATLSQELARQVHRLGNGLGGQARQLVMGPLLEARMSEAALLEMYLNRVHLGHDQGWPVYGIFHAAREYMDKQPHELTPGEAATLAGLLLPPRVLDPHAQVGAVGIRRNEVLRQMLEAQVISQSDYAAALQEPLGFQVGPEFQPMTRPEGWDRDRDVIRLPPETLAEPEPEETAA